MCANSRYISITISHIHIIHDIAITRRQVIELCCQNALFLSLQPGVRIGIPVFVDPPAWILVGHMIGLRERSVRE